jgi:hypothetical protein
MEGRPQNNSFASLEADWYLQVDASQEFSLRNRWDFLLLV